MSGGNAQLLNGTERRRYGFVASFENDAGEVVAVHRAGAPLANLATLCDEMLALDPSYRLTCYSTPATVFADLQGRRIGRGYRHALPEQAVLTQIGRREMLHPRLRRAVDQAHRNRRKRKT